MPRKHVPLESLASLKARMELLPARSPERRRMIEDYCQTFGVSRPSLYRMLKGLKQPKSSMREDKGKPRVLPQEKMEHYCKLIAALKLRTTNKKGRHLSTKRCIELLERYGIETPAGTVRAETGILNRATVDRYLRQWQLDHVRLSYPSPARRFEAEHSNDCWHFDLSPSDLKHIDHPSWLRPGQGQPQLMLFSVVDDRSGACYQEYRCVYGEDTESALRFLFNAMCVKPVDGFPFFGIPKMLYMDNGPIARSRVFHRVMEQLGISVQTHMPASKDKRRMTARAKGKVERPFRTIKEAHETLYHFRQPETEEEANNWLHRYLVTYNNQPHRREPHSRFEDWLQHAPADGIQEMCTWERFCTFAREAESRKVGIDARIAVEGTIYEVDPVLAGETVLLWWGLFDSALYVECDSERFGPYVPVEGAIPLHRYRAFRKTRRDERYTQVEELAKVIQLSRAALSGEEAVLPADGPVVTSKPFTPEETSRFSSVVMAKLAIAREIGIALAELPPEDKAFIEGVVEHTLECELVLSQVRDYFRRKHTHPPLRPIS